MEPDPKLADALSHDPIHGYISFVSFPDDADGEICERQVIDHAWVQRLRQIRQLQSAWWVFPSAEHSRFQHVLGVMHLASGVVRSLYESLCDADPATASLPCVDSLLRMAGLLHDVGHGPFGHFFDTHFLSRFGLNHEILGGYIIEHQLGELIGALRRSPAGPFRDGEKVDPADIAWLIRRPKSSGDDARDRPRWLQFLRSLFCGIYTVDNMDFVLRDAFMTGFNPRSFDLDRIVHYSWFSQHGLTIHERGISALVHFLGMKAELFRDVYYHRTVRAIDLELADLFEASHDLIFPGDPRDHLDEYLELTEFSLLSDVRRWRHSTTPRVQKLGQRWLEWLQRRKRWSMVCQRNVTFGDDDPERSSVVTNPRLLKQALIDMLPPEYRNVDFRVDVARHLHRPHTRGATAGMNFYYDTAKKAVLPLTMHVLYRQLPVSHAIARIYVEDRSTAQPLVRAMDQLLGTVSEDDATNM